MNGFRYKQELIVKTSLNSVFLFSFIQCDKQTELKWKLFMSVGFGFKLGNYSSADVSAL